MKLSFLKNAIILPCVSVVLLFAITSCSKKDGLSSPEEGEPTIDIPSEFSVSPNFNWATSKTIDVNLSVDDQYDGQYFYKLEVFDREPHLEGATLLAAGMAKKGQNFETKITIPTALSQIFVQKTTPRGEVSYSILEVGISSVITGSKVASVSKVAAVNITGLTRLASSTPFDNKPTEPEVPTTAVIYVSGSTNYTNPTAGQVYVVKKGSKFSGSLPLNAGVDGIKVYVLGTWHHANSIEMGGSSKIVVFSNGGALDVASVNMLSGTASLENYGDVLLKSLTLNKTNSFVNVGTLKIIGAVSMVGAANFVNYQKDLKVKVGSMTFNDPSAIATNNGEIEILEGNFTDGTLNANCYTTVGKMTTNRATVNIWSQAKLDVTSLDAKGGVYNINAGSELDVTKTALFAVDNSNRKVEIKGLGTASAKSYARMKVVSVGSAELVHLAYSGPLQVVTDAHPKRSDNKFTTDGSMSVEILWDMYNHPPYVPSTSCNNGGVGTQPNTPPADQTVTGHKIGSYTYMFEDNWPITADYDLNDCVMSIDVYLEKNQANKIKRVVLTNKIHALGAARGMGVAVQLDNINASQVKSVTYSNANQLGKTFKLLPGVGIEEGQSKAVIAVTDSAHKEFGLSSPSIYLKDVAPVELFATIEFNEPISSFTLEDLNPFIVSFKGSITSGKRHEVHIVGRKGTDKLDAKVVSDAVTAGQIQSAVDLFKASGGWPFGISVPVSPFKYQKTESQRIDNLYPKFASWATSNGTTNQDWYLFPKN